MAKYKIKLTKEEKEQFKYCPPLADYEFVLSLYSNNRSNKRYWNGKRWVNSLQDARAYGNYNFALEAKENLEQKFSYKKLNVNIDTIPTKKQSFVNYDKWLEEKKSKQFSDKGIQSLWNKLKEK